MKIRNVSLVSVLGICGAYLPPPPLTVHEISGNLKWVKDETIAAETPILQAIVPENFDNPLEMSAEEANAVRESVQKETLDNHYDAVHRLFSGTMEKLGRIRGEEYEKIAGTLKVEGKSMVIPDDSSEEEVTTTTTPDPRAVLYRTELMSKKIQGVFGIRISEDQPILPLRITGALATDIAKVPRKRNKEDDDDSDDDEPRGPSKENEIGSSTLSHPIKKHNHGSSGKEGEKKAKPTKSKAERLPVEVTRTIEPVDGVAKSHVDARERPSKKSQAEPPASGGKKNLRTTTPNKGG